MSPCLELFWNQIPLKSQEAVTSGNRYHACVAFTGVATRPNWASDGSPDCIRTCAVILAVTKLAAKISNKTRDSAGINPSCPARTTEDLLPTQSLSPHHESRPQSREAIDLQCDALLRQLDSDQGDEPAFKGHNISTLAHKDHLASWRQKTAKGQRKVFTQKQQHLLSFPLPPRTWLSCLCLGGGG